MVCVGPGSRIRSFILVAKSGKSVPFNHQYATLPEFGVAMRVELRAA